MRKIRVHSIFIFIALVSVALVLAICTTSVVFGYLHLGDFRGVALTFAAIILFYAYAIAVYRVFLHFLPLTTGEIAEASRAECIVQVYFLFYLVLFNSVIRSNLLPIPVMRFVYVALGARLGANTYSAGTILDPPLVRIGSNTIIGHEATLVGHVILGSHLSLAPIDIGDNVTLAGGAVVMPGVTIADGATVLVRSVVIQGTHIGRGETWGGNPARLKRGSNGDAAT
jgi:acetyltransferase-like isoleucine patch superfamily enzyme